MKRPVFILGAHKSGTSLLRSLFDGVEGFFTVPIETHFFQHLNWWVEYPFRKTVPQNQTTEALIANMKQCIHLYNTSENNLSDGVAVGLFNMDSFEAYVTEKLQRNPDCSLAEQFTIYIEALYHSIYGKSLDTSTTRVVEKSVENVEFATDLKALFPDAAFIHIVRNPYANLVSIRKYRSVRRDGSRKGYPFLFIPFKSLYQSFYFLHRNRRLIPDYHVIQYEDLVCQPLETIKALCNSLGIPFQESMLLPSRQGQLWQGNSTTNVKFNGISPERINAWQTEINSLEVSLINRYLYHIVEEFHYEKRESTRSPFLPARTEKLPKFIANRFLLLTGP